MFPCFRSKKGYYVVTIKEIKRTIVLIEKGLLHDKLIMARYGNYVFFPPFLFLNKGKKWESKKGDKTYYKTIRNQDKSIWES